jgi:hypothetical protein
MSGLRWSATRVSGTDAKAMSGSLAIAGLESVSEL